MIQYILCLIIFQRIIKYFFSDKDYHGIYRSFFCLFITIYGTIISYTHWNIILNAPDFENKYTNFNRDIFLSYLIFDIIYMCIKMDFRIDLIFHHLECFHVYYFKGNCILTTFLVTGEILSAFNWLNLINYKLTSLNRLLRLLSIIFVRSFLWIFTIYHIYITPCTIRTYTLVNTPIFILLDIYWLSVMYGNIINKLFEQAKVTIENTLTKFRSRQ